MKKRILAMGMAVLLMLSVAACGEQQGTGSGIMPEEPAGAVSEEASTTETVEEKTEETPAAEPVEAAEEKAEAPAQKNGEIYILYTSDVHCGIDQGFGYVGLKQVRDSLEAQGYTTLLVDDGDAVQGEAIGTLTKGEAIIDLMNRAGYDVAIPGNHEFDYGMDQFMKLTQMADFPYISCNFNKKGEPVFAPYTILTAGDVKIGFVGITTPQTLITSTPAYFQDGDGNFIYGFMEDKTGEALYADVQEAVDKARADGADYVYALAHTGMEEECRPWTYADIISHTRGIDVYMDGHSHDAEQVVMKNIDGEEVTRTACGTKFHAIGYSHITEEGIKETGIWSWPSDFDAPTLLSIRNDMSEAVDQAKAALDEKLSEVVAHTEVELTIFDPTAVDASGNPVRMVRRAETNLGDFCADATRDQAEADIALINGGGIRKSIKAGDVTYEDLINVFPFGNQLTLIEATGQQILDALEWASQSAPGEDGAFLQVSGMTYEIDTTIESSCKADENDMFAGVTGPRRVKNVLIDGKPIDPAGKYRVAGMNYVLLNHGDGQTAFDGATVLQEEMRLDNQMLIDYVSGTLGGVIGADYDDPTGQGRITVLE